MPNRFLLKGKMFPVLKTCSFFGFPNLDIGFLSRGVLFAKRICETGRQARRRSFSIRSFEPKKNVLVVSVFGNCAKMAAKMEDG
jgi:hypothetical protein